MSVGEKRKNLVLNYESKVDSNIRGHALHVGAYFPKRQKASRFVSCRRRRRHVRLDLMISSLYKRTFLCPSQILGLQNKRAQAGL